MSSVQLQSSIINSITSVLQDNIESIIRQLADQHNFDPTDAITQFCPNIHIIDSSPEKPVDEKPVDVKPVTENTTVQKKKDSKPSVPAFALPWTNQPISQCCDALRSYYGVYSQCTNLKHGDSNFCKTCSKKGEAPPCGTIYDRSKGGFVAPNGKKPLHYTVFMKKLGKTEQQVRDELARFDITPTDDIFVAPKVGRGRPKKSLTVVDDSDDSSQNTTKKAGRPKKVTNIEPSVDDLIHSLDSPTTPPPSLAHSLSIQIPTDQHIALKQHIPVSPNDDD